jgi:SAM-dependent methyltransferase
LEQTNEIRDQVRGYYGKVLSHRDDLKTGACCSSESLPQAHREVLGMLDEEILNRFYGCGSPIPPAIDGCTVLDLGCGSGRDVYLASYLVGAGGSVIGIDMTEAQLAIAQKHVHTQTRRFGYETPNVDFRLGTIEDLAAAGVADSSIDVVISNCVINLSPDKERVLAEVFRVLKPGGELYFCERCLRRPPGSRILADRPRPHRRVPGRRDVRRGLQAVPPRARLSRLSGRVHTRCTAE